MESLRQHVRKLAAKLNMQPKVFVLLCAVLVLGIAGGAYAAFRPQAQQANVVTTGQRGSNTQGAPSEKSDSEDNSAFTEEYPPKNPADTPNDSPTIEIKMDGTSSKNFTNFMIRTDNGQPTKTVTMQIVSHGVDMGACTVTKKTDFDNEGLPPRTKEFTAAASQALVLEDGHHAFTVSCKKEGVTASMNLLIADGQPERCKGFSFSESAVTANSLQELQSGIVGTWRGCVTQPWVPTYEVVIVFKADGTYDSYSTEKLDSQDMIGLYYGTDSNSHEKKYQLTGFGNGVGNGLLTIFFENSNTTVNNDLPNVKLMGNKLSFSFRHLGQYGPLTFQLVRQ